MSAIVRNKNLLLLFILLIDLSECQVPTQRYGRRPFGVGFLMAGYDVCLFSKLIVVYRIDLLQEKGTTFVSIMSIR